MTDCQLARERIPFASVVNSNIPEILEDGKRYPLQTLSDIASVMQSLAFIQGTIAKNYIKQKGER